jgi:ubiquinone/menaquinone biosynthesis C-methylase UbiE
VQIYNILSDNIGNSNQIIITFALNYTPMFSKIIKSKLSKKISFVLDNFIPPIIRDSKLFYVPIVKIWNSKMNVDFKQQAFEMTEQEFINAYEALVPMRSTDNTETTIQFVLDNVKGKSVLEVGCGNGDISLQCAEKGYDVMATDIAVGNIELVQKKANQLGLKISVKQENVEKLSFDNQLFDTVICLHTLEHVKNLHQSINELKRVAAKRVIVIVPRQKYFRYTSDYHLNFFGDTSQLVLTMNMKPYNCVLIDGCLCFYGDK